VVARFLVSAIIVMLLSSEGCQRGAAARVSGAHRTTVRLPGIPMAQCDGGSRGGRIRLTASVGHHPAFAEPALYALAAGEGGVQASIALPIEQQGRRRKWRLVDHAQHHEPPTVRARAVNYVREVRCAT
jgi:hypothetical protein